MFRKMVLFAVGSLLATTVYGQGQPPLTQLTNDAQYVTPVGGSQSAATSYSNVGDELYVTGDIDFIVPAGRSYDVVIKYKWSNDHFWTELESFNTDDATTPLIAGRYTFGEIDTGDGTDMDFTVQVEYTDDATGVVGVDEYPFTFTWAPFSGPPGI